MGQTKKEKLIERINKVITCWEQGTLTEEEALIKIIRLLPGE